MDANSDKNVVNVKADGADKDPVRGTEVSEVKNSEAATFETAINASGYGTFNIILLLAAVPATFATTFETSTMSYILPIAECDLKLSLVDKGTLNAATYAGMIISAIMWGYLADTRGRKKILVVGFLADAVCVFGSALTQNFQMLVLFKFLGGFFVNGPGGVLYTYMTELTDSKHRPQVLMILGMVLTTGTLILPVLAWAIFPRDWEFILFGSLNVHPWHIFLAVSGLPSLISGLSFIFLPESPKFLMSQGRNAEALKSFQKMYTINTRNPKESFPIKHLVEEVPSRDGNANEVVFTVENKAEPTKQKRQHRSIMQSLRDGMRQLLPIFRKPLLGRSVHVYTMQFCILLGLNTIRLWLPQLFASIAEYESLESTPEGSSNLCTILEFSVNSTKSRVEKVEMDHCDGGKNVSMDMYINNIIVAVSGIIGYSLASSIIKLMGTKRLCNVGLFISACLGLSLYWSTSGLTTLIISSAFITISSISTSSLLSMVVNLFPTSLRTFVVCIAMMFGRLGALSGNMLFPVFVEIGCIPPFLMVGFVLLVASGLSIILPSGKKESYY